MGDAKKFALQPNFGRCNLKYKMVFFFNPLLRMFSQEISEEGKIKDDNHISNIQYPCPIWHNLKGLRRGQHPIKWTKFKEIGLQLIYSKHISITCA